MSQKIHRIVAKDEPRDAGLEEVKALGKAASTKSEANLAKKTPKTTEKTETKAKKSAKPQKSMPKWLLVITWPFRMIFKPFIALGRYVRASWLELRQVRWPSRGATWKMFFAIILYAGLFMGIIALLDMLFTWLFNLIIG